MKALIAVATILLFVPYSILPGQGQGQPRAVSIDELVAPIALYPDALIAQILLSAANPAQVQEFDRWLTANNQAASGQNLQDAAVKAGFEASLVALALFPQVIKQMASDLNWTKTLGATFAANQDLIFASIQKLRRQAQSVGTLKTTPQQEVTTQATSSGEEVIIIEPANPQVVYVPQYNPQVVYTQAPSTTTVIIQEDDDDWEEAVAAGVIGFTAGVAISSFYNPYYYGGYGWYGGGYMYNDGWDDYLDHREDAREDWADHREDIAEDRGDRAGDRQENRSDRSQNASDNRTERQENRTDRGQGSQQQRTDRQQSRSDARASGETQRGQSGTATQGAQGQRTTRSGGAEARGYSGGTKTQGTQQRSGSSDAFSGYSRGSSQRSASTRGQQSRSSAGRSGGGRGGGGRGGGAGAGEPPLRPSRPGARERAGTGRRCGVRADRNDPLSDVRDARGGSRCACCCHEGRRPRGTDCDLRTRWPRAGGIVGSGNRPHEPPGLPGRLPRAQAVDRGQPDSTDAGHR